MRREPETKQDKKEDSERLREIREVLSRHKITRGVSPEKLRAILEDLGPTYVKLGQIMSMHSDILPQRYCDELCRLNSAVAPIPLEEVYRVLDRSYGESWQNIFSKIEPKPLGSASIAQVHRAVLTDGTDVIIKVQREGVWTKMSRDIRLLHKAVHLLPPVGDLRNLVDLDQVLDEMWSVTQEELDFLREADNMEEFARLNREIRCVRCPKLYREHTTAHVLVMEYIGGWAVDDREGLEAAGYDLDEIGEKLVNNYIKQIMEDGFFHADPHPGNVKVCDGKIIWIDMGMMGRLSERDRRLLTEAIRGVASRDVGMIEGVVLQLGEFWGKPNREKLYKDIRDLLNTYGNAGMGDINIPEMFRDLTEVMKQNQIGMPHGLTMLARGLTHMEGVLAEISPSTNMVDIAKGRIKEQMLADLNWREELEKGFWRGYQFVDKGTEIPTLTVDIMKEYLRGQARMNMELKTSQDFAFLLRKLVRNMVTGLWVASLLISSSIICLTDLKPTFLGIPLLGALGFLLAFLIVVYVVIVHIVTRKK